MSEIDPHDCLLGRACLEQGNPVEAARVLLSSPHREQPSARLLLLMVNRQLIEQATQAYQRGELTPAQEALVCAARCAALPVDAIALRDQILREQDEREREKAWQEKRMEQARAWVADGRLRSGLGLLAALDGHAEARRLQLDYEELLEHFQRYLRECRQHLDCGETESARVRWRLAQAIMPDDPEVLRLQRALPPAEKCEAPPVASVDTARLVLFRNSRPIDFVLGNRALVLHSAEIVIGNPLGEGVHVPLQARIHRRHAVLRREGKRYTLMPSPGCGLRINGQTKSAPCDLNSGDMLEFGVPTCAWLFSLPVAGSSTVVLEPAQPSTPSICLPDGMAPRMVVLLDDTLQMALRSPAHLLFSDLPCETLCLRWTSTGLLAEARGGTLSVAENQAGTPTGTERASLLIENDMNEADRIGLAFAGYEVSDSLALELRALVGPGHRRAFGGRIGTGEQTP
jgi:hypothetical protein